MGLIKTGYKSVVLILDKCRYKDNLFKTKKVKHISLLFPRDGFGLGLGKSLIGFSRYEIVGDERRGMMLFIKVHCISTLHEITPLQNFPSSEILYL